MFDQSVTFNSTLFGFILLALFLLGCKNETPRGGVSPESSTKAEENTKEDPEIILEYASTRYLMESEELASKLKANSTIKLIDMRDEERYSNGHIEGAINVWRPQITDATFNYGGMMSTKRQLEELLGNSGITPSDTIIIYDDKAECDAARLWWILKYFGHENMALLNGGLVAWELASGALSNEVVTIDSVQYKFTSEISDLLYATQEQVRSTIGNTDRILLDTRGSDEFTGERHKDGAARAGAIPGAVNMDWALAIDYHDGHKFFPAEKLKSIYAEVGIDGTKPVITYCHSGVRSAHTLFVLTELLGYKNVRNYDGSWIEWSHLENTN